MLSRNFTNIALKLNMLAEIDDEKQLDDDFVAARWCDSRAATDRIVSSAGAGSELARDTQIS